MFSAIRRWIDESINAEPNNTQWTPHVRHQVCTEPQLFRFKARDIGVQLASFVPERDLEEKADVTLNSQKQSATERLVCAAIGRH